MRFLHTPMRAFAWIVALAACSSPPEAPAAVQLDSPSGKALAQDRVTPGAARPPVRAPSPPRPDAVPEPTAPPAQAAAKQGACTFQPLQAFQQRTAKWEGDCENGKAHGLGALRAFEGSRVVQIFFGKMENGQAKIGAIDSFGGYEVGEFKNGKIIALEYVEPGDFNIKLQAFETATAAAKHVSDSFKRAGNMGSANYYAARALELERQIE